MIEVVLVYVASGMFAGVVAAMFGVGGGFAVAPLLLIALTAQNIGGDYTMHLTVGTTQAVIFVTASYSAVLRWRAGDTNFRLILRFAPLVAIGALVGAAVGDDMQMFEDHGAAIDRAPTPDEKYLTADVYAQVLAFPSRGRHPFSRQHGDARRPALRDHALSQADVGNRIVLESRW